MLKSQPPQNTGKIRSFRTLNMSTIVLSSVFFVIFLVCFVLFFEGESPQITFSLPSDNIGKQQNLAIEVADKRSGLRKIEVLARQGEKQKELLSKEYPRNGYWGKIGQAEDKLEVLFSAPDLGFKDGDVDITIIARDYSQRGFFAGNKTVLEKKYKLDTLPPKITLIHNEQYVSPGGCGIALYKVSETGGAHGVVINGHLNPGHPVSSDKEDTFIAYFAVPYDAKRLEQSVIQASDAAGNKATVPISPVFQPVRFKSDKINISESFLASKIPEFEQYYPGMKGDTLEKYIYVNQNIRVENNAKISEVCSKSDDKQMWTGAFFRMLGSSKAGYADHRTYMYNGKEIDQQTHLGMDIASLEHSEVKAANAGKVVFADYLGIYGNMVILDHGQGVFSLYSHLSQINATVGAMVDKLGVIGLTGTTGMAGGDHLHFSMLVNGVFVTPIEWWDPHWIKVTIDDPLKSIKGK